MTREEAIAYFKDMNECTYGNVEPIQMAIKALEQQPCEDCISREKAKQFLYERLDRLNDDELYDIFSKIIDDMYNELPSVTPATKWHKVEKEGCPKAAGKYLVVRITEYGYKTTIAMWLGWDESWVEANVVAWMPLPEWEG